MSRTIDEADEQIKFVATNSPRRGEYSRRQVVIDAQVWPLAFSEEGVEYARKNGYTGRLVQGPALATWLEGNFRGPSTVDPIPGWKRRLRSLSEEKDEHAALDKYCNFIRQTQALRDALSDQEAALISTFKSRSILCEENSGCASRRHFAPMRRRCEN